MTREEMIDMFGAFEEKSLKKNENYLNEIVLPKTSFIWNPLSLNHE
jgi:hypothetical protein